MLKTLFSFCSRRGILFFIISTLVLIFLILNKEERIKKFKSMTSQERQKLILNKMKDKGIDVGSGVPNKNYDSEEVCELIIITNCLPGLRRKI
tara:strand:+ start:233 stop:511 length:279 start_codon:yes stop_codon:yes gene_type:complete